MAGLFDGMSDNDKLASLAFGLMGFSGGVANANRPGASLFSAVGGGFPGFAQGVMAYPQMQQQRQLQQLQGMKIMADLQKAQADLQQRLAFQRYIQGLGAGTPGAQGVVSDASQIQAQGQPGVPSAQRTTAGAIPPQMIPLMAAMDPDKAATVLANVYAKQVETGQWERIDKNGNPDPGGAFQRNKFTGEVKAVDPTMAKVEVTPMINMPPVQTEEQKAVGKFYGETFTNLQNDALKARSQNARLDALSGLLDKTYTGAGAQTFQQLKRAAKAAGFDVEGVGEADAAQAIANQMALELRSPAGGAGMPGALSDRDREFLVRSVPGLIQTPEGRRLMIDAYKKMNQRSIDVAKLARDYRRRRGMIDEGFFDELQAFAEKNPLFAGMDVPTSPAAPRGASGGWSIQRID